MKKFKLKKMKLSVKHTFMILGLMVLNLKCSSTKTTTESLGTIEGTVKINEYYCDEEKTNTGKDSEEYFLQNTTFYAFKDSLNSKQKFTLTTNEFGQFSEQLPHGNYKVYIAEKINSPKKFLKLKTKSGDDFTEPTDACYERWLRTPEFTFLLSGDKKVTFVTINYKCKVENNPCIQYSGSSNP